MDATHSNGNMEFKDLVEWDNRAPLRQAALVRSGKEIPATQFGASPHGTRQISTAVVLAAGTGTRLQPLTCDAPKCLTEVNGESILQRLITALQSWGFDRVVVVVGYLDHSIREALQDTADGLTVEFIYSPEYETTNNIYSLWLARQATNEPFVLIESDLVFDTALLAGMLAPGRIAVSRPLPWMNGTTVTLDPCQQVTGFYGKGEHPQKLSYKTVNMYSFSPATWRQVAIRLDQFVSAGRVGEYYERVFAELVDEGSLSLQATLFDSHSWYEIDTLDDLHEAEKLWRAREGDPTANLDGERLH